MKNKLHFAASSCCGHFFCSQQLWMLFRIIVIVDTTRGFTSIYIIWSQFLRILSNCADTFFHVAQKAPQLMENKHNNDFPSCSSNCINFWHMFFSYINEKWWTCVWHQYSFPPASSSFSSLFEVLFMDFFRWEMRREIELRGERAEIIRRDDFPFIKVIP